jgi:iron complex transport system ATP-binding protein
VSAPALAVRHVSFAYAPGGPEVLSDVSLEAAAGSITAVLGSNGSGKTTLLRLALGLLRPTRGTIEVDGQPQHGYSRRELSRRVGLVPQSESVAFELSVLEFALMGRAPHLGLFELPGEADRTLALEAIERVGLSALAHRAVPTLSGGEAQLATIARALVQQAAIMLSDEPTSHLDPANTRRVLEVLRMLGGEGRTVVFTTHDPNLAAAIADHVVLLKDGRVLAAAPTFEVLTTERLSATYGMEVEVVQLRGRPLVVPHSQGVRAGNAVRFAPFGSGFDPRNGAEHGAGD